MDMKMIGLMAVACTVMVVACGTEPSGEELTPSVLSLSIPSDSLSVPRVSVAWTECLEESFESYVLYRSETADIESDPSQADIVWETTDRDDCFMLDVYVEWDTTYYYALKTCGEDDAFAWSNEDSISTGYSMIPSPSVLEAEVESDSVYLAWNECGDQCFESYTLYRSTTPGVSTDPAAAFVFSSTESSDTTFTDCPWEPGVFYYALKTTGETGLTAWSNEVTAMVAGSIPTVQDLTLDPSSSGTTVILTWSAVGGLIEGYEVYFKETESADWILLTTVGPSTTSAQHDAVSAGYYSVRAYLGSSYSEDYANPVNTMPFIITTNYTIYDNYSPANYDSGIIFGPTGAELGLAPNSSFTQDIYLYDESLDQLSRGDMDVSFYSGDYGPFGNGYETHFQEPQPGTFGYCDPDGTWIQDCYTLYPSDEVVFLELPYAGNQNAYVKVLGICIEPEPTSANGTMVSFSYEYQPPDLGLTLFTTASRSSQLRSYGPVGREYGASGVRRGP